MVVAVTRSVVSLIHNAFMKNNNAHAVAFNLDTGRWQFATPIHRQAVVCVAGLLCTCSVCDGAVPHFSELLVVNLVAVVDAGTAAGAREGE